MAPRIETAHFRLMAFLLDSSFVIAAHRSRSDTPITARFRELISLQQAAINEVVRFECLVGCRNDDEMRRTEQALRAIDLLAIDRVVWALAIELGSRLRRIGVAGPLPDVMIAATAIRHSAVLLHIDSDFETIAQHSDLRTESYLDVPYA